MQLSLLSLALLVQMPPETFAWLHSYDMFMYDVQPVYGLGAQNKEIRSPSWTTSNNEYALQMRLPDLDPASVSAALAADDATLQVTGTRKIESCTCTPTIQREISLPYRPRAEDIDVTYEEGLLTLKLARHAKAAAPVPLKVNVPKLLEQAEPHPTIKVESPASESSRPLRFVPHSSAKAESDQTKGSLAEQEQSALSKFRGVAQAALATSGVHTEEAEVGSASAKTNHDQNGTA